MKELNIRVLIVDDYEPWLRFVVTTLEKQTELQIIGQARSGLEAVQKAQELRPDLILLDISLPELNGIEAARRIREHAPQSKILFVSENHSWDIAQAAFGTGAGGYLVKSDAVRELLPAIRDVVQGKQFVSAGVVRHAARRLESVCRHEAGFYSDDQLLLDALVRFIEAALNAGNAVIVTATESHLQSLLPRLQARGLGIGAAIEQGRYVALDAAEALSNVMLNGMPDPVRFLKALGNLIVAAARATGREQARVAIFGECVQLLWGQGNQEAVIQLEKLGNQLAQTYDLDILCGYSLRTFQKATDTYNFHRICAEHSAVHCL